MARLAMALGRRPPTDCWGNDGRLRMTGAWPSGLMAGGPRPWRRCTAGWLLGGGSSITHDVPFNLWAAASPHCAAGLYA